MKTCDKSGCDRSAEGKYWLVIDFGSCSAIGDAKSEAEQHDTAWYFCTMSHARRFLRTAASVELKGIRDNRDYPALYLNGEEETF